SAQQSAVRRDRLAGLWIEAEVLRLGNIRARDLREKGVPGPEGSVLKLGRALLSQRIHNFTVDLLGAAGMICSGYESDGRDRTTTDRVIGFLHSQSSTIA